MDRLEAFDLGLLYWFGSWQRPWLDRLAVAITHLGDPVVLSVVTLAAALLLLRRRQARLAGLLVLVSLLSWGLEWSVKQVVDRPRPNVVWALIPVPDQPSFPSGHALRSTAVCGSLGIVAGAFVVRSWLRRLLVLAGVALGILIGLTRVYLGVHYPLDVLAGWVGGLLFVALAHALVTSATDRTGASGAT